ncbi:hypothetical protein [Achromobacter aegrifaciens]
MTLRLNLFVAPHCALVPVEIPPLQAAVSDEGDARAAPADTEVDVNSRIEIELNGARVRVHGKVDPIQLRQVLRCLMPV